MHIHVHVCVAANCMTGYIFLPCVAYQRVSDDFATKRSSGTSTNNVLHQLAWNVDEISRLTESGRKARTGMQCLLDLLENDEDQIQANFSRRLSHLKCALHELVKGFYRYQRTAAAHVLVIMISTETRNKKPYALPVQCIPYKSFKDSEIP